MPQHLKVTFICVVKSFCRLKEGEDKNEEATVIAQSTDQPVGRSDSPYMGDRTINRSDRRRRCQIGAPHVWHLCKVYVILKSQFIQYCMRTSCEWLRYTNARYGGAGQQPPTPLNRRRARACGTMMRPSRPRQQITAMYHGGCDGDDKRGRAPKLQTAYKYTQVSRPTYLWVRALGSLCERWGLHDANGSYAWQWHVVGLTLAAACRA
eukprot:934167-Pleurochrysis_carterae.AAC.2